MSHNHPYRRPLCDSDLRPEPGPYGSADRRHASPDHDFYRPPPEHFSSPYPSTSSSRGSAGAQWSQDSVLNILNSCGLEPDDLALLAKLPEDVLTVDSLPHLLQQIKGKRGMVKPFLPRPPSPSSSSSSYPPSSTRWQSVTSSSRDWDQRHSQVVRYPLDHTSSCHLPSEQDRWGTPLTSSSVRADVLSPSSSSSSGYIVLDFHHRSPSEFGKTGRVTGPASFQDRATFSAPVPTKVARPSRFSDPRAAVYRSAPPPEEYQPQPRGGRRESEASTVRSGRQHAAAALMPSQKEARDFHGTCPKVFPYSCSLCDITVLSEKVSTLVALLESLYRV